MNHRIPTHRTAPATSDTESALIAENRNGIAAAPRRTEPQHSSRTGNPPYTPSRPP